MSSASKAMLQIYLSILATSCFVVRGQIAPQVPISVPSAGFYLEDGPVASSRILVEAFLDINCPDSANVWSDLRQLSNFYKSDMVLVRVMWSPLPFHRNSIISTQGYHAVTSLKTKMGIQYISTVFKHVAEWSSAATANLTEAQVLRKLATYTEETTGIPAAAFLSELPKYRDTVIAEWKLAAKRSIAGTPWYFVNGIDVGNGSNTFEMWTKFLDGLLKAKDAQQ